MIKNRNKSIDFFRIIAAFLVILIHSPVDGDLGRNIVVLARISVPFFFIVSGYFLFNADTKKIKRQIIYIIELIFFSNLIYILFNVLRLNNPLTYLIELFTIKNLFKFIIFNEVTTSYHLWFLNALCYVLIIYYFTSKYKINKYMYMFILPLMIMELLLGKYSLYFFNKKFNILITRNFLFLGLPFFYVGNIIRKYESKIKINIIYLNCFILLFLILSVFERYILEMNKMSSIGDNYVSTKILSIAIFILLIKNEKIFACKWSSIGCECALGVYIIHPIIIYILKSRFIYINMLTQVLILICSVIIVKLFNYIKRKHKLLIKIGINKI